MQHELHVSLCHNITARAHLAGAEAAELEAQADEYLGTLDNPAHVRLRLELLDSFSAARRRYWRELEACELLKGRRWPEAEALGVEPSALVSISQED